MKELALLKKHSRKKNPQTRSLLVACNRGEDNWWQWKELCLHGEPYPEHLAAIQGPLGFGKISREQWSGWRAAALNHHPRNARGTLLYPYIAEKSNFPVLPIHPRISSDFQRVSYKLINSNLPTTWFHPLRCAATWWHCLLVIWHMEGRNLQEQYLMKAVISQATPSLKHNWTLL